MNSRGVCAAGNLLMASTPSPSAMASAFIPVGWLLACLHICAAQGDSGKPHIFTILQDVSAAAARSWLFSPPAAAEQQQHSSSHSSITTVNVARLSPQDLGFADTGIYSDTNVASKAAAAYTPNITALAREGIRLTHHCEHRGTAAVVGHCTHTNLTPHVRCHMPV